MFDIENIAINAGVDADKVRTLLPDVLNTIRNYTNRAFITSIGVSDTFTIKDNIIKFNKNVPSEITEGSYIELYKSLNNTKIYVVKAITNNSIEVYGKLFDESFNGSIIKLSFANIGETDLASMVNYKNSTIKLSAVKSESMDGYSYTLNTDDNFEGYPLNLLSAFNSFKQLPQFRKREYYERGFINIPLCR
jgi:hypothetical protein